MRQEGMEIKETPSAYIHVMVMEDGQICKSLSFNPEPSDSFGQPGVNYSASYKVYAVPLHEPITD